MRSRGMRVLVILPVYGRALPTGAFVTSREYVHGLVSAGHTVDVVTTIKESGEPRTEDGVRVWPLRDWRHALRTARPELVITHHGDRKARRITSQAASIPHLLMVHGMSEARDLGNPGLAWFPSEACRDHYADYRGQALVLSPPISPVRYRTTPGSMVTLNGSTVEKGADVLAQVAARMPEMRFLMVRADGHTAGALPPNVVVADRTDPRRIYAQTQVLLMPSTTESYGRAGVEAMLSGIPVIAAPLPGIREALGDAATYIPREDVGRWVTELRRLTDPAVYAAASARCRTHANGLDYAGNLWAFEAACRSLRPRHIRPPGLAVRPPAAPRRGRRATNA
ncbi:glycosyltransferase family 4 protein [Streptomyces sp. NBC_00825]|uniref:glycosyltransferase family 4 protein n=1 Tax=unclassified Streptomyces TaxID=2593676 RepID=UPI002ED4C81E|nr:glycosyltransferase family 4 protein [Streptomyces sp. NBC_00826]WTH94293.1 glycosyltransferase family 4 protein [Streptomyces sp. NBC_00825]WTI03028.1 glycosyltransferase family 4 protein [Streptomyces sp. NBC_00822]